MLCSNCGRETSPKAASCRYCGNPLPAEAKPAVCRCAACSAPLPKDAIICSECGTFVSDTVTNSKNKAVNEPAAVSGEEPFLTWQPVEEKSTLKKRKSILVTIAVAVLVLVVIVIALILLGEETISLTPIK